MRRDVVMPRSWELRVRLDTPEGQPLHERLLELRQENPRIWDLEATAVATADPPPPVFPATDLREVEVGIGEWSSAHGEFARDRNVLPRR